MQQQKRKKTKQRIIAGFLILLMVYMFPIYHIPSVLFQPSYYSADEIARLAYRGGLRSHIIANDIMAQAETAFSEISLSRDEAIEQYGLLSRYTIAADSYHAAAEKHRLKLWSAHFGKENGTMWVWYTQEGLDSNGERITGSWNIPSLWMLEKNAVGQWEIVKIKEHP